MTETAWKLYCELTEGGMDVACDPSQLGPNVIRQFEQLANALSLFDKLERENMSESNR